MIYTYTILHIMYMPIYTYTHNIKKKLTKKLNKTPKCGAFKKKSQIKNLSLMNSYSCFKLHRKGGERCFSNWGIVKICFLSPLQLIGRLWNICVFNHKEPNPFLLPFDFNVEPHLETCGSIYSSMNGITNSIIGFKTSILKKNWYMFQPKSNKGILIQQN
jgi:hypothetical protein